MPEPPESTRAFIRHTLTAIVRIGALPGRLVRYDGMALVSTGLYLEDVPPCGAVQSSPRTMLSSRAVLRRCAESRSTTAGRQVRTPRFRRRLGLRPAGLGIGQGGFLGGLRGHVVHLPSASSMRPAGRVWVAAARVARVMGVVPGPRGAGAANAGRLRCGRRPRRRRIRWSRATSAAGAGRRRGQAAHGAHLVGGEAFAAVRGAGHLVGLPHLAGLAHRSGRRHRGLLLGARRRGLAPAHLDAEPEGEDQSRGAGDPGEQDEDVPEDLGTGCCCVRREVHGRRVPGRAADTTPGARRGAHGAAGHGE